MRLPTAAPLLALLTVVLAACSGGNAAGNLAGPPAFDPKGQTKCGVTKSQAKPLIVEWPSADRGQLETSARKGLVVVRYEGCEMEVLDRCKVTGSYVYAGMTRKDDKITMRDSDELYASIPVYAAKFEAKLQKSGELNVAMTMVGRYAADRSDVLASELQGDCSRATHFVTALTAGAFEFFAGADAEIGGGASVMDAGGGARSVAKRETLNKDGDKAACEKATSADKAPPEGCGALLRVEVAPLGGASPAPPDARQVGDDACSAAGAVLVGSCGFEVDAAWLPSCNADPAYKQCLRSAAHDCSALALCGFDQLRRAGACGGGMALGAAGCEETTACETRCGARDLGCLCGCAAKMSRGAAIAVAQQNACNNLHCGSCSSAADCEQCFSRSCGATFARSCKGR